MADTNPVTLADLKTIMEIKTDAQDDVLNLIINNTTKALRFKLDLKPTEDFPEELSYIALEVCVRRYNRRKNEGMTSYEQEGQSFTFKSNDFDDFADDINDWKDANGKNATSLGTVSLISGYPKR
ncbi:phage head-tail connector protein [Lacticaseibacillus paracasei subsp. tolerans]|uniref:phage head-tail connector protein n=1 Tax=Lacticaseibacillus paracasei TaxID=1597 RepID=UPI001892C057|nr:phage head-tail connector protein [Lacticaseibacillus paracasei]QPC19602.1 phage head-tail connector protein [Lacticaseibacillus paracasei subsp. tolerans]